MEYLSQERYAEIASELNELVKEEMPRRKNELVEAREKGDLSENFEYHAAKRAYGKLLGRIRFLQRVLENSQVLDPKLLQNEVVGLLRKVTFTNLNNDRQMTYTIVNPHEADMKENKISIKSPIAEALLGKKTGDVVEARVPSGLMRLRIDQITV